MPLEKASIQTSPLVCLDTVLSTPEHTETAPCLVLLHYAGGSSRTFSVLIDHLKSKFKIVAPTLRGWIRSSETDSYRMAEYSEDIVNLIGHLQTARPELVQHGIVLVGHSMGGKISQVLLGHPRIQPLMRGMVLVAPAPAGSHNLSDTMREQQIQAYSSADIYRFVLENVLLGRPDAVSADEVQALVDDAMGAARGAKMAWPEYGIGEDHEHAVRAALSHWGPGKLRVLIAVGELDRVETPTNIETKVVHVLDSAGATTTVSRLPSVGHLIPVEAPEALARDICEYMGNLR